ncbi:MAG: 30S ribosomal protein S1 [Coprothermobacterota bacterium]|nr:30S ribosomal protein S1 [Coprothermobacterota bacterium]
MKREKIETGETTPLENEPTVSELVEAPVEETTPLEDEPTVSELVEAPVEMEKIEIEETTLLEDEPTVSKLVEAPVEIKPVVESYPQSLMEQYLSRTFKEGDIIQGVVVAVEQDQVLVDIGAKSEGVIPAKELTREPVASTKDIVTIGDRINCYVVKVEDNQGNSVLSKRRADYELAWTNIQRIYAAGEIVEASVARSVKGGVLVDLGIWGFVPRSQIGMALRGKKNPVGEVLRLKVIELDTENRKFTCSARKVEEEEKESQKMLALGQIKEGTILKGKVARITNFGVFVDLGGVDGLIHISELTWGALRHPSKFVVPGQEVQVKVLKFSPEEGRISLSLRQVETDPWDKVELKYPVGSTAQGKVVKIGKYGAIVELERGISGLVHISELSDDRVEKAEDAVKPEQDVLVKVINLKKSLRRITLSMKQTELERESTPHPSYRGGRERRRERVEGERPVTPEREEHFSTIGDFWKETEKE